ncbi:hypothetical protein pipiens_013527, partial [Culex pipiens pipiens]
MFGSAAGSDDGSPDGPCVDAARDELYCPPDKYPVAPPARGRGGTPRVPKAAPRTQPPTPKPRS